MKTKLQKLLPCLLMLLGLGTTAWADGIDEPIPSFYQEPGMSRTRDYVNQHPNERIDPFTGKLQYHFTDLFIPGNGGLDIAVQRSYSSLNEQIGEFSPVGMGWTMHFGRVLRKATTLVCDTANSGPALNPVLELPDGGRRILYKAPDNVSWITTDFWKAQCNPASAGGGLDVFSPDGTKYEMTAQGHSFGSPSNTQRTYYTSRITDRNGNQLNFTYVFLPNGFYAVKSVAASDGRSVTFVYTGSNLTSVTDNAPSDGRVRSFTYGYSNAYLGGDYLRSVTRPGGESWLFDYNTAGPGQYSLRQITYPSGGVITYTYNYVNFATLLPRSTVVTRKVANPGGTWTWAYTPATQPLVVSDNSISYSIPPNADQASRIDQTTMTGPDESRTYLHMGYNSVSTGFVFAIGAQLGNYSAIDVVTSAFSYTFISSQANVRPGSSLAFDNATYAVRTKHRGVYRPEGSFEVTYSNPDVYGNPRTVVETGNATRTTNITYNIDTAKWFIRQKKDETVTEGTETLAVTRLFDGNGNVLTETRAGVPTSFTYTSGDLATRTDARGKTTTYSNYYRGIPRTELQPENITITRTVSDAGNVTSQTDGTPATTSFSFDGLNRVTGITHPRGNPVTVAWAPNTRTVTRGAYTGVSTYDGFDREVRATHTDTGNASTITQTFTVDSLGRRVFASYPNSTTGTKTSYDLLSRPTFVYNEYLPSADTWTSSRQYNYGVELRNERNMEFFNASRFYGNPDGGQLMSMEVPLMFFDGGFVRNARTVLTRNIAGQVTSVTQDGVLRSYGYDTRFYQTSMTEPETGTTAMGRDAVGNMTSRTVGASPQTTYTYDDRNRLTVVTYPAGTPSVVNTYYNNDLQKSVDNGVARRDYVYDTNQNLTNETLTVGLKVFPTVYTYNGNDAHDSIQYGSNRVVTYAPDAFGRPRQAAPYVTTVAYHPTGQPSSFTYANGYVTTIGLDGRKRPSTLQVNRSGTLFNTTYAYDHVSNVTAITDSVDSQYNRTLSYDGIDRLTEVSGPWGYGLIDYDLSGNIISQNFGSFYLGYGYDSVRQRLRSVSGSKNYTMDYDVYGNVSSNGTNSFLYNDASNMKCAKCGLPGEVLYDYDGSNQRVASTKAGVPTYFMHGHGGHLLWEETPHSTLKEYIYLGGKQVAVREESLP
jgi:YD repeat-containing protein